MKRIDIGLFVLIVLIVTVGLLPVQQPARAQNESGKGWIEGVIVFDNGEPAGNFGASGFGVYDDAVITIRPKAGNGSKTTNDRSKGGFYTFRDIQPGEYEVFVDACRRYTKDERLPYRPQHIFGLVVEPDRRTKLDIIVHEGKDMEEIGKPTVPTQKAIIISEELARLQQQIDELKKK